MRQSITVLAAAALLAACSEAKFKCSADTECPTGTVCDTGQKLCVIPGGCDHICATNERCQNKECIAQSCPVCNANEVCDDTTFKCVAVTDGTIALISPAAGGVIGGPSSTVTARAGAPNGGPLHVDFTLKDSGGTTVSTVSVATGDLQGNYTGTLDLSTAVTGTGATLVATVFWKDTAGATQQKATGPTTVNIDKTAPSVTGISSDQPYYSTVVGGTATVTATVADSGGSSGIKSGSVQLTVGSGTPIAGTLQTGSTSNFQFAVPLAGLSVGANAFTISASDVVNNVGTQGGTLNVDNTAPVFGTLSVPTAFFSGTASIAPAITAAITDSGGAGVQGSAVKIKLDSTHFISNDSFSLGTATWNSLTGASFLLPDGQQATVSFNFVGADTAGNPVTSGPQSIKIDRKGPAVGTISAPGTYHACSGSVSISAPIDDDDANGGSGAAGATLHISGQSDITGVFQSGTAVKVYGFTVPASVQAANTDTAIPFTITGADNVGNATPSASAGTGNILIDCAKPVVNSIAITGGIGVSGVAWFKQQPGTITVTANILEKGSGVNASTLQLQVPTMANLRIDNGTPVCGAPNGAGVAACTFSVAQDFGTGGTQTEYDFVVVGADNVGNTMATGGANGGKVGIDGQGPTITFTVGAAGAGGVTTNYPAVSLGCAADSSVFCGHDGTHFWRKGEAASTKLFFTVDDTGGVGPDTTTTAKYWFTSGTSGCTSTARCTATYESGNTFSLPADFTSAPFASDVNGNGTTSITVVGQDAVGNVGGSKSATINVTRVKWMRSMANKVVSFKASPVVTSQPVPQIILGGAEGGDSLGPLVSLKPDGTILWRGAHNDLNPIASTAPSASNFAYSSATNFLYVVSDQSAVANSTNKMFAYHVAAAGIDASYTCAQVIAASPGKVYGSPAILTDGSVEYALVADQTQHLLWAFTGTPAAGCSPVHTPTPTAWTGTIYPPSVIGATNTIYVSHGTASLAKVPFTGGSFGTITEASSFSVPVFNNIAIAGNLFFGDRNATGKYYQYDATTLNAATIPPANTSPWVTGALGDALTSPPIVSTSFVFGTAGSGDTLLHAFNKSDASVAFTFSTGNGGNAMGALSPVALGADNVVYFSEDHFLSFYAVPTGSGATTSLASGWSAAYHGSSGTSPSTAIDSITTEATLDGNGIAYFGTAAGNVYAIITDSGGPLAPSAGTTWPRVGYDNCNSSNTAFNCQ